MSRLLLSPYSVRKRSTLGWMVIAFVTLICFTCLHPPLFDLGITPASRQRLRAATELAQRIQNYPLHPESTKIGLILSKTRADDIRWIHKYAQDRGDVTAFIYSTERWPEADYLIPSVSRGREVAAYLSYVVDYYDRLPPYSIFIHSKEEQWHNDLFGPLTPTVLHNLRLEAVDAHGYVNLRCTAFPGCPSHVHPHNPTASDLRAKDTRVYFAQIYQELFGGTIEQVPMHIGGTCCAQFAVSRKRIRERPKSDYERMLRWVRETDRVDGYGVGWVFETLWHVVFGMDAINCPRYEQCRCDNFGWCGPLESGEVLIPAGRNISGVERNGHKHSK